MASNNKLKSTDSVGLNNADNNNNNNVIVHAQDMSSSGSTDFEKYDSTDKAVEAFTNVNPKSFSSYKDWEDYFKKYEEVLLVIADYEKSCTSSENKLDVTDFTVKVNYSYDSSMVEFNKWQAKNVKDLDEKIGKQQITTLSVFSIFMTLLTFLLANISKVAVGDTSVKSIVVTNLILLCVASTIFLFIGVFLGLVGKNDHKALKVIKHIVLFSLPVLFLAAVVLFCVFYKE